jgi:UMP-CMP kinase
MKRRTNLVSCAPCSGKSTLCTSLADRYGLDHFSIGNEMREFIKAEPTGPAALIKPTFTADEIATYKRDVKANTLAPVNLTPKYVKERTFGVSARPGIVRILIDGFPRDAARWPYFKDAVEQHWTPSDKAVLIVLHASRETTKECFEKRGRAGDEFDKRFDEHEKSIDPIMEAMKSDGLTVIELSVNHGRSAEELIDDFERMPQWISALEEKSASAAEEESSLGAP